MFVQVVNEKGVVIKRKTGQLAIDVGAAHERSSKNRLCGQQTIMEGSALASSLELSSAIANLIYCHGPQFTLF